MRNFYDSTISELDYEGLPPALRRKYFSSLERLRLAQDGVHPSKSTREFPKPFTVNTSKCPPSRCGRRPSTKLDERLCLSSHSPRNRLRKSSRPPTRSQFITPEDVAHFASLPPALRRKQFSREEQVLLASRINSVILDAADEAIYKQYWSPRLGSASHPRLRQLSRSQDQFNYPHIYQDHDMEITNNDIETFRWLDEPEDLDLSLYDYHAALTETATKPDRRADTWPVRRSLSVSNIPFHKRNSSKKSFHSRTSISTVAGGAVPPIPSTPVLGHQRNKASTSSLDPTATHYQDPAARMKLRVYLASPQKFDEAIEFGFPSLHEQDVVPTVRPRKLNRSTEDSARTFFNDSTPSLSDGDDQEFEDIDSPRTPSASAFSHGPSHDSGLDRSSFRPRLTRDITDPYVHAPASNREMTLHMTLTRPDLRSPEETFSTKHVNSQPLEQTPLEFMDGPTAFWDSLPDEESKVKKLLRKFKLRT